MITTKTVPHIHRPTHGNGVCYSFLTTITSLSDLWGFLVVERKSSSASPNKRPKDFNLENVLRRCSADDVSHESILQLKDVPRGVCIVLLLL